jgi:hypothetical protein
VKRLRLFKTNEIIVFLAQKARLKNVDVKNKKGTLTSWQ